MNDKIIEQYLAAYYNGTATEQEEKQLIAFFTDETTVPLKWLEERKIFLLLQESAKIEVPEGLGERLEETLNQHIKKNRRFTIRRTAYKIAGIAAAVLLCMGIGFYQGTLTNQNVTADTYENPQDAAIAAGEALAFLSSNLNKGMEQVSDAKKEMQHVNEVLNNQLK